MVGNFAGINGRVYRATSDVNGYKILFSSIGIDEDGVMLAVSVSRFKVITRLVYYNTVRKLAREGKSGNYAKAHEYRVDDYVVFNVNGDSLKYIIYSDHLEILELNGERNTNNDLIFILLDITDVSFLCGNVCGYESGLGIFPTYKTDDMVAATKIINYLQQRCDKINGKSINKKDEVQTIDSKECGRQVVGEARVSSRGCSITAGSRPKGNTARVKGRDSQSSQAKISGGVVIGRPS